MTDRTTQPQGVTNPATDLRVEEHRRASAQTGRQALAAVCPSQLVQRLVVVLRLRVEPSVPELTSVGFGTLVKG
jgi:hypothetical protein